MKTTNFCLRRTALVLHYLAVGYILVLNMMPQLIKWDSYFLLSEFFALSIIIWGFIAMYAKTGIWRYTHLAVKRLSDGEKQEMNSVIRKTYTILAILIVVLLFVLAILKLEITAVVAVIFLYLAHILPGSILAWNNMNVGIESK